MTSETSRITINPEQCSGRPCVRGLRMPVAQVLEMLSQGMTHEEILEDYPYLEQADIFAVLRFAALETNHPILLAA